MCNKNNENLKKLRFLFRFSGEFFRHFKLELTKDKRFFKKERRLTSLIFFPVKIFNKNPKIMFPNFSADSPTMRFIERRLCNSAESSDLMPWMDFNEEGKEKGNGSFPSENKHHNPVVEGNGIVLDTNTYATIGMNQSIKQEEDARSPAGIESISFSTDRNYFDSSKFSFEGKSYQEIHAFVQPNTLSEPDNNFLFKPIQLTSNDNILHPSIHQPSLPLELSPPKVFEMSSMPVDDMQYLMELPEAKQRNFSLDEQYTTKSAEIGLFRTNQKQFTPLSTTERERNTTATQVLPSTWDYNDVNLLITMDPGRLIPSTETSLHNGEIRCSRNIMHEKDVVTRKRKRHGETSKKEDEDELETVNTNSGPLKLLSSISLTYEEKIEMGCHCTKTKCLKLYCDCFQRGKICKIACACYGCKNTQEESGPEGIRTKVIKEILKRRPDAFQKRVRNPDASCACKNSKYVFITTLGPFNFPFFLHCEANHR